MERIEFIKRVQLLNRINIKGLFLLLSLGSWGILPLVPQEWWKVLVLMPVVFLLEDALNGKLLECPHCSIRFKLRYVPIVIATGKCYCCGRKLFELPPAETPVFDRNEFIAYHRHKLPLQRIVIIAGLFGIITCTGVMLMQDYEFFRLLYDVAELAPVSFCGLFILGYYLCRLSFTSGEKFDYCPHCRNIFSGNLPEVTIATGRCGACGRMLMMQGRTLPENHVYRLPLQNRLPEEFFWFTQMLFGAAIFLYWVFLAQRLDDFVLPLLFTFADGVLLCVFFLKRRCHHHKPDEVTKVTGICGVCGGFLGDDRKLFESFSLQNTIAVKCDRGKSSYGMIAALVIIVIIAGIALYLHHIRLAVLVLINPGGIFLIAYLVHAKNAFYAIEFAPDSLILHGKKQRKIEYGSITGIEHITVASRDKKRDAEVYLVKISSGKFRFADLDFVEPEKFREAMNGVQTRCQGSNIP